MFRALARERSGTDARIAGTVAKHDLRRAGGRSSRAADSAQAGAEPAGEQSASYAHSASERFPSHRLGSSPEMDALARMPSCA